MTGVGTAVGTRGCLTTAGGCVSVPGRPGVGISRVGTILSLSAGSGEGVGFGSDWIDVVIIPAACQNPPIISEIITLAFTIKIYIISKSFVIAWLL